MKKLYPFLLIALFIIPTIPAYTQNYAQYHRLCNTADSLGYTKSYQAAIDTFEKAFSCVDYAYADHYVKAYHIAACLGDYSKAYRFGKMAMVHAGTSSFLDNSPKTFKTSASFVQLSDSITHFQALYAARLNTEYIRAIDSLYYIDQAVVRQNKQVKGNYAIDEASLPGNLFLLDSANWHCLYRLIQQYGFPSEKTVGPDAYTKAAIIIHHNLRLPENEKYHAEMIGFIQNGEYLPQSFSFWYEQFYMQVKGSTFFTTWDGNTGHENSQRIDANRRNFYLKGMASFKIKGRKMYKKW